jgi:hypothetical protein
MKHNTIEYIHSVPILLRMKLQNYETISLIPQ